MFSQSTIDFLKTVMLERINIENTKEFLLLIYRIDIDFFYYFLEKRWQSGRYNAVVSEIYYAQYHIRPEGEKIIEKWYSAIFEKLPQLSEYILVANQYILYLLQISCNQR